MFSVCYVSTAGSPGEDQDEDPEAREGNPGPARALQGAMHHQLSHPRGVW